MLKFKIIQELKPNEELLEIIKNYNYTIKNGKIKHLMATNLQYIETINYKNDIIKKEIENLNKKKQQIDPNNDFKEYTIELLKKTKLYSEIR